MSNLQAREKSSFSVQPSEGIIPAEKDLKIVVTANVDDCVRYFVNLFKSHYVLIVSLQPIERVENVCIPKILGKMSVKDLTVLFFTVLFHITNIKGLNI